MFRLLQFFRKLIFVPMRVIVILVIPFSWIILLLMIFLIYGCDKGEFNDEFNHLNQTTKQIFISCTKGMFY